MIVETLESWLLECWPAHYEPTRHIEGTYGLVFVLEAKESNVSPQKFCVKTLNPEKLKPGGHDIKRLFEREMRLWLSVPPHYHVLPALGLETYRAPMEKLGSVVFDTLREYWLQKGVELDERAIEVLRQDGSLRVWWAEYWARKGWHS